jgi:hypothetical protein
MEEKGGQMTEQEMPDKTQAEADAEEVTRRNVVQARELLARKHEQEQARGGEPPLTDDPHIASGENPLVQEAEGVRGSTGGIRNMGGGRS